jgi:16S rRNA G966 N2-methylase RsmD
LNFDVALKNFAKNGKTFDIVFLDPPYKTDFAEKAILLLKDLKLLGENSIVVWEHDTTKLKHIKSNFENATTKKYGDKFLTYLLYNDIINIH